MRPEIDLILRTSAPSAPDPVQLADASELDTGFLLDTAFRHRVAALVGVALARLGWSAQESRHEYVLDALRGAYALNKRRNEKLIPEAVRLSAVLRSHGIRSALRKGAYLTPAVYKDWGLRPMNDIDLFVDRAASADVLTILEHEGYAPGHLGRDGEVNALSRRQSVFWSMHINNLPPHHRRGEDGMIGAVTVDICFDLFLPASGGRLPAESLWREARPVDIEGTAVLVFRPEHFLLDVASHLYKESTTLRYIEKGKHQRLLQYVDIVAMTQAFPSLDWDRLIATADGAGVLRNVYFALANTEILYPSTIPTDIISRMAELSGAGDDFLRSYGQIDGHDSMVWSASNILERLFTDERPAAESHSPV